MAKHTLIILFTLFSGLLSAQTINVSLSGQLKSGLNGEAVPDGTIVVKELNKVVHVGANASYRIYLIPGTYTFTISAFGFDEKTETLKIQRDTLCNFILQEQANVLDEAVVSSAKANGRISRPDMGVERLQIERIKAIPALMGEVDVIKTLQLLPGVQSAAEGSSGFNVRGGTPDQNLVLLDNAPMYNVSHLLGFFSVFNNDMVKDIQLYKGDIPVSQGGRLSSVLEVNSKDGNDDKIHASGGIGTISSRLTLDGPIVDDKLTFLISGRRTYVDLFLKLSSNEDLRNSTLYFYDLNAKLAYRINANNRLYLSGYMGNDKFGNKLADMDFGNKALVLRWNHLFSDKVFSDVSAIVSNYGYKLYSKIGDDEYRWNSNIIDYGLRADFTWLINPSMTFRAGVSTGLHNFKPGDASSMDMNVDIPKSYALEHVIYASNQQKIGESLTLKYGLRFSLFQNIGAGTIYSFTPNHEKIDSTVYPSGDIFNTYTSLEPRVGFVYELNPSASVKGSYSRTTQFLHLVSNSAAGSPLDIWLPATPNVKPQTADQASLGFFKNFLDNTFETSVELFYKKMNNVVDFKDHPDLILNPAIEGELRIGDGESYGLELLLRKNTGRLSGWLSYTFTRSRRMIPEINDGKTYLSPSDRPHSISLVATYEFSKRVSASLTWLYATGTPVTYPVGRYEFNGQYIPVYDGRNTSRMPDYHRMDLSLTWRGKQKAGRRWHGEWNFSLYNAYGRKNPWFISFMQDKDNPDRTYAEMVYLFSFVPSITYNFTF